MALIVDIPVECESLPRRLVPRNVRLRRIPSRRSVDWSDGSDTTARIPLAIDSSSYGSTRTAARPATSGMEEMFDVTTGVPHAIASRTGRRTLRRSKENKAGRPRVDGRHFVPRHVPQEPDGVRRDGVRRPEDLVVQPPLLSRDDEGEVCTTRHPLGPQRPDHAGQIFLGSRLPTCRRYRPLILYRFSTGFNRFRPRAARIPDRPPRESPRSGKVHAEDVHQVQPGAFRNGLDPVGAPDGHPDRPFSYRKSTAGERFPDGERPPGRVPVTPVRNVGGTERDQEGRPVEDVRPGLPSSDREGPRVPRNRRIGSREKKGVRIRSTLLPRRSWPRH